MLKNRVNIHDRPDIVAQKTRMGDWEGDTANVTSPLFAPMSNTHSTLVLLGKQSRG